jgi:hypothetical protein
MAKDSKGYDFSKDAEEVDAAAKAKKRAKPLPLTEALVLDIVEYLLANHGYGHSTQISSYIVQLKPRRYTSREVVGILRNRPMFRHAMSKDRRGGIRWRLDVLALTKYLKQKGYQEKAEERGVYQGIRDLKWAQLSATIESLEAYLAEIANPSDETLDICYERIATLWS